MEKNDSAQALSRAQPTRPIDWGDPEPPAGRGEGVGGVLGALVGVEDHPGDSAAAGRGGHVDRRGGELGVGVGVGLRETEHAPAEQILDCGNTGPSSVFTCLKSPTH